MFFCLSQKVSTAVEKNDKSSKSLKKSKSFPSSPSDDVFSITFFWVSNLKPLLKSCFFSPRTRSLHFHLAAGSKNHNFIIKLFTIPKVDILSIKIEKLTKRHLNKFLKMVRWRFCQFLYFGILFLWVKMWKATFWTKIGFLT